MGSTGSEEKIRHWSAAIESMDYFALLRLPRPTTPEALSPEELKKAFGAVATAFHPDRYREESEATRKGADTIFRRVNEAFRVLKHPQMRARYQELLAQGKLRMPPEEIARASSGRVEAVRPSSSKPPSPSTSGGSVESLVSTPAAQPFARLADAALASGDPAKAKLQMQLALSKEPNNVPLLKRLEEVSAALAARTSSRAPPTRH
jgi:curved DNA-binding protein CbpA